MGTVSNIQVDPQKVTWGTDTYQVQTIATVADSAGSLNDTYFFLFEPDGTGHYFWFNIFSKSLNLWDNCLMQYSDFYTIFRYRI